MIGFPIHHAPSAARVMPALIGLLVLSVAVITPADGLTRIIAVALACWVPPWAECASRCP